MTDEILLRRGNILVRRLTLEPGEAMPWHRDPYHRVGVVLSAVFQRHNPHVVAPVTSDKRRTTNDQGRMSKELHSFVLGLLSKNMCRSIKQLRFADAEPTDQELYEAALQFVRKVSGYRKPSQRNEQAFELAVREIAAATRKMLDNLVVLPAPVRATTKSVEPHTQAHTLSNRHDRAHPRRKSERR